MFLLIMFLTFWILTRSGLSISLILGRKVVQLIRWATFRPRATISPNRGRRVAFFTMFFMCYLVMWLTILVFDLAWYQCRSRDPLCRSFSGLLPRESCPQLLPNHVECGSCIPIYNSQYIILISSIPIYNSQSILLISRIPIYNSQYILLISRIPIYNSQEAYAVFSYKGHEP